MLDPGLYCKYIRPKPAECKILEEGDLMIINDKPIFDAKGPFFLGKIKETEGEAAPILDKIEKGSSPELSNEKKLAEMARTKSTQETETSESKSSSWLSSAGKAITLMMAGLMLMGGLGLTGCAPQGGGETKRPETQVEQEAPKTEKKESSNPLDKYLTPAGKDKLKELAGKVIQNPAGAVSEIKDEAGKFTWETAKEAGKQAAQDYLKKDSDGVVETAKELLEGDKSKIGENAGKLIEKGKEYTEKKLDEAKETAQTVKETTDSLTGKK